MSVVAAVAIGTVFAAVQTVVGTLIALVLDAVLLTAGKSDIYEAATLTAAGAVITGFIYQVFDPTFLTITQYLGMPAEERVGSMFSHMVFPILRFTAVQLVVDILLAKLIYRFTYREKSAYLFTGLYTVTKVALAISIWTFLIVPAFAQTL